MDETPSSFYWNNHPISAPYQGSPTRSDHQQTPQQGQQQHGQGEYYGPSPSHLSQQEQAQRQLQPNNHPYYGYMPQEQYQVPYQQPSLDDFTQHFPLHGTSSRAPASAPPSASQAHSRRRVRRRNQQSFTQTEASQSTAFQNSASKSSAQANKSRSDDLYFFDPDEDLFDKRHQPHHPQAPPRNASPQTAASNLTETPPFSAGPTHIFRPDHYNTGRAFDFGTRTLSSLPPRPNDWYTPPNDAGATSSSSFRRDAMNAQRAAERGDLSVAAENFLALLARRTQQSAAHQASTRQAAQQNLTDPDLTNLHDHFRTPRPRPTQTDQTEQTAQSGESEGTPSTIRQNPALGPPGWQTRGPWTPWGKPFPILPRAQLLPPGSYLLAPGALPSRAGTINPPPGFYLTGPSARDGNARMRSNARDQSLR